MEQISFYKPVDLARILDVNVMTIYRYIKAGKLRAYKFGKEYRIEKVDFECFLDEAKNNK
jgi:excisionase family DNA binding protein